MQISSRSFSSDRRRKRTALLRGKVSWAALVIISGVPLAAAASGRAEAQSFPEALASAYNTNPSLLAERANLRGVDENVPQALSNWRPTVTISASGGVNDITGRGQAAQFSPGGLHSTLQNNLYGVQVTQALFRGGRTVAQTEQAVNLVNSERAHLESTEQTVLLTAVTDYVDVLLYQADLDLNLNNEQVLRRQLEAARDRFEVGEVTRTDVSQAEASYAQAIASRQQALGNLQTARANFQRDIGIAPTKLQPPVQVPVLPTSREEATGIASTSNPDVISAQFTQEAAENNIRVVQGALLPTVSVTGTAERATNQSLKGLRQDELAVTAQVSMPLYEGGSIYSQSRQAQQTVSQRRSQVDQARKSSVDSASAAWDQLSSVRAEIVSFKQQIRANSIALEGVQQEAAVGERTVLDILNAEQTLFQSRVSLVQAQHDEVVAKFTLAQALGRLTARNLGLPVKLYDPSTNYDEVRDKWLGFGTGEDNQ